MPPPSPPPAAPRACAPHSAASFTAQSNTAAPPPPRQPRASSAFSRLANIALTGASTTGAAGAGGAATAGSPSFASVASTNSNTATSRGGGALDALETIAHADQDRWKFKAGGGGGGDDAAAPPTAGGSTTRTGSASRYEPRTRSSGSRTGWRTRDLSESRSRERRPPLSFADSGGSSGSGVGGGGGGSGYLTGVAESPLSMSFRSGTGWAGGAGGEQLPPNASVSAFSSLASGGGPAPGESHFFPHGSSAFSFETSGGGVSVSPWGDNNSYRSSVAPSFGGLDGSGPARSRVARAAASPLQYRNHHNLVRTQRRRQRRLLSVSVRITPPAARRAVDLRALSRPSRGRPVPSAAAGNQKTQAAPCATRSRPARATRASSGSRNRRKKQPPNSKAESPSRARRA